jgi:hypothetical protein
MVQIVFLRTTPVMNAIPLGIGSAQFKQEFRGSGGENTELTLFDDEKNLRHEQLSTTSTSDVLRNTQRH